MIVTKELAENVLCVVDVGLVKGLGKPVPGQMCVEAAVNYAMGAPHGDTPSCVGRAVRSFKIRLNDSSKWPSDAARAEGMRRLAVAQLGSDALNQIEFAEKLAFKTITVLLAKLFDERRKPRLADACRKAKDLKEARAAAVAAAVAAAAAADAAAVAAAVAAAAADAYAGYAADAADAADALSYLLLSAKLAEEVLVEMKSPGAAFLWLCDEK